MASSTQTLLLFYHEFLALEDFLLALRVEVFLLLSLLVNFHLVLPLLLVLLSLFVHLLGLSRHFDDPQVATDSCLND
jgi:hypothetical protein